MKIVNRVNLFYVALAWSGTKFGDFAEECKVSRGFLHDALWKKKRSARVNAAIHKFTQKNMKELNQYYDQVYRYLI